MLKSHTRQIDIAAIKQAKRKEQPRGDKTEVPLGTDSNKITGRGGGGGKGSFS